MASRSKISRRRWSEAFKKRVVKEASQPDKTLADVTQSARKMQVERVDERGDAAGELANDIEIALKGKPYGAPDGLMMARIMHHPGNFLMRRAYLLMLIAFSLAVLSPPIGSIFVVVVAPFFFGKIAVGVMNLIDK